MTKSIRIHRLIKYRPCCLHLALAQILPYTWQCQVGTTPTDSSRISQRDRNIMQRPPCVLSQQQQTRACIFGRSDECSLAISNVRSSRRKQLARARKKEDTENPDPGSDSTIHIFAQLSSNLRGTGRLQGTYKLAGALLLG